MSSYSKYVEYFGMFAAVSFIVAAVLCLFNKDYPIALIFTGFTLIMLGLVVFTRIHARKP